VAVFDNDPGKVGKRLGPFTIQALSDLPVVVQREQIRLGIIAVPADHAQDVAEQVVAAGVRGLLNFAPVSLNVPPQVAVSTVDVAVHLEQLSFQVNVTPAEKAG
jgi:redox-sensing transcriptional repressor